ncbi:MAG: xanthine dehydrogenase family protein molybdopterin-binding subunit [Acidobacteriota bacterium]
MAESRWPDLDALQVIGKRIHRLDGPVKVTGRARYAHDINRPGMLWAKVVHCPHAHARVRAIDTKAASALPGVKAVRIIQGPGSEIQWAGDEVVAVAAISEEVAADAAAAVRVDYEVLPHFVEERRLHAAPKTEPGEEQESGDPDSALSAATVKSAGTYGLPSIAHCCLEAHGQVCEWDEAGHLTAWCSTQNVSGLPGQFADGLDVAAADVRVRTDYMGGGFGSKFSVDRWGIEGARLARDAAAPVKLMLERAAEIEVAGDRPSAFASVRVGAARDGRLTAWISESWGSGGLGGSGSPPLPYLFAIPDRRHRHTSVPTHIASSRAWRAPNHPQACFITMAALEDTAARAGLDPLDFFLKNIDLTGRLADTYRDELAVAARLMDWKKRWHPRGQGEGILRQGLGLAMHTWGGRGHRSNCEVRVHPDGAIEARLGSQDLGTGTRTIIAIVLAETFGVGVDQVSVQIGDSRYPPSGASGGSTTVGGVSASTRRAAQEALSQVLAKVAPALDADPAELIARDGRVQVRDASDRFLAWPDATARIGVHPISVTGSNPGPGRLTSSGVGGVQMADVTVDMETGVVRVNKMVAVQDCGLILDEQTAESQVYGGLTMGVSYALLEEKIVDPLTGRLLNGDMEFYKLAGLADVGEFVVHLMRGPAYEERGVIGLGEPPVISPGAAIANAVANATGVRVPELPLTPDRVIAALEAAGSVT